MGQLFIFDLDGTLVNSRSAILSSIHFALQFCELNHLKIDEWKAVQQDLATSLREAAVRHGYVLPVSKTDEFIRVYREHHAHRPEESMDAYEGIRETLEDLKSRHQLAVATTKHSEQARHILTSLRLHSFFDHIQGTDPGLRYKPAPDILHATLKSLNRPASDGVYFGDSPHDIEAAKSAEMMAVGVSYGFAGAEALEKASPHAWIHHPRDILNISSSTKFLQVTKSL